MQGQYEAAVVDGMVRISFTEENARASELRTMHLEINGLFLKRGSGYGDSDYELKQQAMNV